MTSTKKPTVKFNSERLNVFPFRSQLLALLFRSHWRSSQCNKREGKRKQGRERGQKRGGEERKREGGRK